MSVLYHCIPILIIMGYHIILCTHLLRKEESWKAQHQSQRRENATKDNSDGRENHEVIWCVLIFRRLGGNHRLLYEQHHNNNYDKCALHGVCIRIDNIDWLRSLYYLWYTLALTIITAPPWPPI